MAEPIQEVPVQPGVQTIIVDTPEAAALRMSSKELIAAFDPNEPDSPIAQRLKLKAGDKPFMVWNEDTGERIVEASANCLDEITTGYAPRPTVVVAGRVCPVLPLLARPNIWVADQHLLYTGDLCMRVCGFKSCPWHFYVDRGQIS